MPALKMEQILAIETSAINRQRTMEIDVQSVLDLCEAAKSVDVAITTALHKVLEIGEPEALAGYATVEHLGQLWKNARDGAKKMYAELHGPDGAKKRAEDAEAAARVAWRRVAEVEAALGIAIALLEAVEWPPFGGDHGKNATWREHLNRLRLRFQSTEPVGG